MGVHPQLVSEKITTLMHSSDDSPKSRTMVLDDPNSDSMEKTTTASETECSQQFTHVFIMDIEEECSNTEEDDALEGIVLPKVVKLCWIPRCVFLDPKMYDYDLSVYQSLFEMRKRIKDTKLQIQNQSSDDALWTKWKHYSLYIKALIVYIILTRSRYLQTEYKGDANSICITDTFKTETMIIAVLQQLEEQHPDLRG